jgi:hypothetical protein
MLIYPSSTYRIGEGCSGKIQARQERHEAILALMRSAVDFKVPRCLRHESRMV